MSLYAQITGKTYNLPMEWDKCDVMYRHLKRLTWDYQFVAKRRMFQTAESEYRCALVKWLPVNATSPERRREVLVETSDPQHMESVLLMLISEADAQAKAYRHQQQITMLGDTNGL